MKSKKYPKKYNKKYTKKRKQKKRLTKARGLVDSFVSFTQPPPVVRKESSVFSSINDATINNTIEREGELYVINFIINHLYSKLKTRDEKIEFLADFQNLNNPKYDND